MLNLDRMIYLIVSDHPNGPYLPERDLADLDRATTVRELGEGQFKDVILVLEINPVEGICRDCTQDILREADWPFNVK